MTATPQVGGGTELRTLQPGSPEYRRWIDISADAYPTATVATVSERDAAHVEQRDLAERQPEHRLVGAYRAGSLVGGMRVYDFTMCVREAQVFSGGVGSIAVGLEHKRRGIAHDLIRAFLNEYRERDAALAVLYAFRPDFYRKLGFGYGAKLNQYRLRLDALPASGAREHVRLLGPDDTDAFLATYNRIQARTNGLIRRERWRAVLRLTNPTFRTFGYCDTETLRGYVTVEMRLGEAGSTNCNELYLHELVYEHPAALAGLLAFAHSQSDQFAAIVVNTHDPDFHFLTLDPRNGSDRNLYPPAYHETNAQGVGAMYRVINFPALIDALSHCAFGTLDGTVRIVLADAFFPPNAGVYAIRFSAGRPRLVDAALPADVDLAIDVADFSALVMGSVRLRALVRYGRAVLSNVAWMKRLDAGFDADAPQCLTRF